MNADTRKMLEVLGYKPPEHKDTKAAFKRLSPKPIGNLIGLSTAHDDCLDATRYALSCINDFDVNKWAQEWWRKNSLFNRIKKWLWRIPKDNVIDVEERRRILSGIAMKTEYKFLFDPSFEAYTNKWWRRNSLLHRIKSFIKDSFNENFS